MVESLELEIIKAATSLISEITKIKIEHKGFRKGSKQDFNFFEGIVANKTHYEDYHSNFIRYLIDTNESHDCGTLFLEGFILLLREKSQSIKDFNGSFPSNNELNTSKAIVRRYANGNYIDFTIESEKNWIIFCENKIEHFERKDQLQDYYDFASNKSNFKKCVGVFLTPTGRRPTSINEEGGKNIITISYQDIIIWLRKTMPELLEYPQITSALSQYVKAINKFLNPLTNEEMEKILEFLEAHPENAELIFQHKKELNEAIDEFARKSYANKLISQVEEIKLEKVDFEKDNNFGKQNSGFYFYPKIWNKLNIRIAFCFNENFDALYYGIYKDIDKEISQKLIEEVKKRLGKCDDNDDDNLYWPFWRWYKMENGENRQSWNEDTFAAIENETLQKDIKSKVEKLLKALEGIEL